MSFRIILSLNMAALMWIGAIQRPGSPQSWGMPDPGTQSRSRIKMQQERSGQNKFRNASAFRHTLGGIASNRVFAAAAAVQAAGRRSSSYRRLKVEEWRTAVAGHNPGEPDSAAVMIGGWDAEDLEIAVSFITKLASRSGLSARRALARESTRRLLQLTDQEVQQGNLNRILKGGALLHTDIALLKLQKGLNPLLGEKIAVYDDGRVGVQTKNIHWAYARRLLDSASASPFGGPSGALSKDPMIRRWYIATTAHMLSRRLLAYARHNIECALEMFPSDDRILFYAGVLHETWASPSNQNILLPPDRAFSYGSKESELKQARRFFRSSIAENPDFPEAHLRLGRVLGLLDLHYQAVAELQIADAAIKDPQLSYYTALFLGREYSMLNLRSNALDQYERAAKLYPNAQSPLLALSHFARSGDDTESALLALERIFELKVRDPWKDDPWWVYDLAPFRDAAALVAEMHKMFGELER